MSLSSSYSSSSSSKVEGKLSPMKGWKREGRSDDVEKDRERTGEILVGMPEGDAGLFMLNDACLEGDQGVEPVAMEAEDGGGGVPGAPVGYDLGVSMGFCPRAPMPQNVRAGKSD